jgi:hypothetical protein
VFGSGGFACATHASVIKALRDRASGKQTTPQWVAHYPNKLLYKGKSVGNSLYVPPVMEKPPQGLIHLSACDDGTLLASVSTRTYNANGTVAGDSEPFMCTTARRVDLKTREIILEDWTTFGNGNASQVQKLPMHGYSVFESTKADLSARS